MPSTIDLAHIRQTEIDGLEAARDALEGVYADINRLRAAAVDCATEATLIHLLTGIAGARGLAGELKLHIMALRLRGNV